MRKLLSFQNMKIQTRLLLLFVSLGIGIILVVSYIGYSTARELMETESYKQLAAIRDTKKIRLQEFIRENLMDLQSLSDGTDVQELYARLIEYHTQQGVGAEEAYEVSTEEYRQIHEEYGYVLEQYVTMHGYADMYVLCMAHGHVMYSTAQNADLGSNLQGGPYRDSGLAAVWKQVSATQQVAMQDFQPYEPAAGKPIAFIAAPITTRSGESIGVLALQISVEQINAIMRQREGLGETGESYLVGGDYLMRSDSFLDPHQRSVMRSFSDAAAGTVQSLAVKQALSGKTGDAIIPDYREISVLSSYTPVDIFQDIRWALLVEIDESEAFQHVSDLRNTIVFWSIGLIVGVMAAAVWVSRTITGPLHNVVRVAKQIAEGDLHVDIEVTSEDEIGRALHAMQDMVAYIHEVADVAERVAAEDLQVSVLPKSEYDVLNQSLAKMVANLHAMVQKQQQSLADIEQRNEAMQQQSWLKDGVTQLSAELAGEPLLKDLCRKALTFTARYVNAGQGVVYVYDQADEELRLYGSFAFTEREEISNSYRMGAGVVGQVAFERQPILLKHPAPEDGTITTGTFCGTALNTYTLPLVYEDELYGVLELASFTEFTDSVKEFLHEAIRVIATGLFSTAQRERVQQLLNASQQAAKQAEQATEQARQQAEDARKANVLLEEKQQELEQQAEELRQMTTQLEEREQELQQQQEELRQQNARLREKQM